MNVKLFTLLLVTIVTFASPVFAQKAMLCQRREDTLKGEMKLYSFDNLDRLQNQYWI